jgi:cytochrome c551/c552
MRNTQKWGFVVCVLALWAMGGAAMAGMEEGQQVFAEKKCITCHTLGDQKAPRPSWADLSITSAANMTQLG